MCLGFAVGLAGSWCLRFSVANGVDDLSSVRRTLTLDQRPAICAQICACSARNQVVSLFRASETPCGWLVALPVGVVKSGGCLLLLARPYRLNASDRCQATLHWRQQHSGNRATDATSGRRAHRHGMANQVLSILQMKDLSKDSVTWLEVGEEAEGQRVDNFLLRIAKGGPKNHIQSEKHTS